MPGRNCSVNQILRAKHHSNESNPPYSLPSPPPSFLSSPLSHDPWIWCKVKLCLIVISTPRAARASRLKTLTEADRDATAPSMSA